MLCERVSEKALLERLKQHNAPPFPPASDRNAWLALQNAPYQRAILHQARLTAEKMLSGELSYPAIPLRALFAYAGTGDRMEFETAYFQKRTLLSSLVIAECSEYQGRFLPAITEGIWQLLNEPFWYVSAHANYNPGDPMPRCQAPNADLFACQTGMTLAMVYALLGPELDHISQELGNWVKEYFKERIVKVIEAKSQWWMEGVNNWTPWCASNAAGAALQFLRDKPERLAAMLHFLAGCCDRFYDRYAPDGGCDEGPCYYQVAGLKLMNFIEWLNCASGDAYHFIYDEAKMQKIAEYFYSANLTGTWFASMADSSAQIHNIRRGLLYRFAKLTHNEPMCNFVLRYEPNPPNQNSFADAALMERIADLFWTPLHPIQESNPHRSDFTALPDLQFFVMRECPAHDQCGMIFSIKGGHNNESHNHNDVGQFELFNNGKPILIDLGTSTYTRFTFSEKRYESWVHSAAGHNVPVINGILQPPGEKYRAAVLCAKPGEVLLDLTQAWPSAGKLVKYTRRARLRNLEAELCDTLQFAGDASIPVTLNLYCAVKPEQTETGIRLGDLNMEIQGLDCSAIAPVRLEDPQLIRNWGEEIHRITLTGHFVKNAQWTLRWKPISAPASNFTESEK